MQYKNSTVTKWTKNFHISLDAKQVLIPDLINLKVPHEIDEYKK